MSETNTTNTDSSSQSANEHASPSALTADRVARLVTELGAGWARYGLTLGRLALRQSAKTLETAGELLGELATRVESISAETSQSPSESEQTSTETIHTAEVVAEVIDEPKKA